MSGNGTFVERVIERADSLIIVVDAGGRIRFFNRKAQEVTGYGAEQVLGKSWGDLFVSREEQPVLREILDSFRNGIPVSRHGEYPIRCKDGREVVISWDRSPIKDDCGAPEALFSIGQVLNSRKALEVENHSFEGMVSRNKAFKKIFRMLPIIAESTSTVLISGESGTGKELVAAALHNLSPRREKPFVRINSGALPETLLESELFGYRKGAFTGATQDKPGRFKLAEGGTVFLDEIGNISLSMQAKLLRVLETREYELLGGTITEKADVRIIAATNRDLWSDIQAGRFHEDLYYRLCVLTVDVPPLRERPEDIALLIDYFLTRLNETRQRTIVGFTPSALGILLNHDYPGNVRELQNIVEHAFTLCQANYIGPGCLPESLREKHSPKNGNGNHPSQAVNRFETELIQDLLRKHGGRVKKAAEEMGIHRTTLWRKIRRGEMAALSGKPSE